MPTRRLCLALFLFACNAADDKGATASRDTDDACLIETYEVDCDADGVIEQRFTSTFDASGNLLAYDRDGDRIDDDDGTCWQSHPADGIAEYRETYTYDARANLLIDEWTDDDYSRVGRTTNTYDTRDNLLTSQVEVTDAPTHFATFTYDADDHLLSYVGDNLDYHSRALATGGPGVDHGFSGDGTGALNANWYYDPSGNLLLFAVDAYGTEDGPTTYEADGFEDYRELYYYDADGNPLTFDAHWNTALGVYDEEITRTYDTDGNVLTYDYDGLACDDDGEACWGPDGIVDLREVYTYEGAGRMLTRSVDGASDAADGVLDASFAWTYDTDGNVLTYEVDQYRSDGTPGIDGTVDYRETATYDADGHLLTFEIEGESLTSYAYDGDGNLVQSEVDTELDGVVDSRDTYTWDAAARMLTHESDEDADGTADWRWSWTYTDEC